MLLKAARKLEFGTTDVSAVYLGAAKVWPSTFDATLIPGLVVWLDGADVGTITTAWPDKSGTNHPGTIVGGPAPSVQAAALNGKSVVRFTVNQGRVRISVNGLHKDYTIVSVTRMWGTVRQRCLSGNYPQSNSAIGHWQGYMDICHEGSAGFFTPDVRRAATTEWRMWSTDAATTVAFQPRFFINGVYKNQAPNANGQGLAFLFNISGYDATGTQETSDCEVAELLIYNRKLADAERQQVEGYLLSKWGL